MNLQVSNTEMFWYDFNHVDEYHQLYQQHLSLNQFFLQSSLYIKKLPQILAWAAGPRLL